VKVQGAHCRSTLRQIKAARSRETSRKKAQNTQSSEFQSSSLVPYALFCGWPLLEMPAQPFRRPLHLKAISND
jgi:hypothetical protein